MTLFARQVALLVLSAVSAGCSFYTSCPTGNGTTGNGATGNTSNGGSGNNGGGSNGGSGNTDLGPIPTGAWVNVTSNLAGMDSECGNMSYVFAKPDEDMMIAGIAQKGLWSSTDGGMSWTQLGTGKGSDTIINRASAIVFDPANTSRYWESGLYNSGAVYETTDDGATFKRLGDITHSDLVSVDLGDPDRKTLLAGGHEQAQTLNLSTDAGQTWTPIGSGLPAMTNCTFPLLIDAKTFLVGCAGYGGGVKGVYSSADAGMTWNVATDLGGTAAPLQASDGSIYWEGTGSLTRSTDNGVTWSDELGKGLIGLTTPRELPDGRIISLGADYVLISADNGMTWKAASSELPFKSPVGIAYSAQEKAFIIWHNSCGFDGPVPVPDDAIMRYDFDYTAM